ncbi:MAG: hypothetical protein Q8L78_05210, partial [Coxiellaceae bacterium]|nr:hypothetical protein [Coxiellaceae bacterium]
SAANRPRRLLFCRFLAPWNNHAAAKSAKNDLGGVDFRYRRPKSDRLLEKIKLMGVYCFSPVHKTFKK